MSFAIAHIRHDTLDWRAAAQRSRTQLDHALEGAARLTTAALSGDGVWRGAFQRPSDVPNGAPSVPRGSGGAALRAGEGVVWLLLELAHPAALTDADPPRLLNRYVRPILRAITRHVGAPARYFGRDVLDVGGAAVAGASFAFDSRTERCAIELLVSVTSRALFDDHPSQNGKRVATLSESSPDADPRRLVDAVVTQLASAYGITVEERHGEPNAPDDEAVESLAPSWNEVVPSPIGAIGVATSPLRLGGSLMIARDQLAALHADLDQATSAIEAAELTRTRLGTPRAALFGVRDIDAVAEAVARAWSTRPS